MNPELLFCVKAPTKLLSEYLLEKSLERLTEEQKIFSRLNYFKPFSSFIENWKTYESIICQYLSNYIGDYHVAFSENGYCYAGLIIDSYPVYLKDLDTKGLEPLINCELFSKEPMLYPYCMETFSAEYNPRMELE
jgi:hypothetical protein